MLSLASRVHQLKRTLRYLRGYVDFDTSNTVTRRTDFSQCERPVLLLYGFMSTRRVFDILEHRLRRDGFGVWSINLGGMMEAFNTRGIDSLAERVRDKIDRLYERFPTMGPLSIVGHSKGGLIGAYYVKRLGGDRRVKSLVTMGTPFNGSPSAYFGILSHGLVSRSIWQMTPMSPFIRRLAMGAFPAEVQLTSIYSKGDRVNPFPTCILEATPGVDNVRNVEVADVAHRRFVTNRTVYHVVRRSLFTAYGLPVPEEPRSRRVVSLR
ncbi:MAG: alpha/beta fold hydrolase [Archangium sp.]|nr:alpha/beta fold hydrolase [Archangium sp.]